MSNRKRNIVVCLVAFSLIILSGMTVYGGLASAGSANIHPKDKQLEVKVDKKILIETTIMTEIVSMKLVGLAPITVKNFQGDGNYHSYPMLFDIFTEIEYNGIKSNFIEQRDSIFELKVEVIEDEETVSIAHGFLGNLNFEFFDGVTLTSTFVEAHIDGSFVFTGDVVTGDY
ncbi:MAG: hypothetical protein JSW28_07190 [Thermoplasmata archaeon]|nr:MAG: hypothetical protein JSW28_07190 [Thermoplasmata archaeon]